MRFLFLLLLASLPILSGSSETATQERVFGVHDASSIDQGGWGVYFAAQARCTDLQQRCAHHSAQYVKQDVEIAWSRATYALALGLALALFYILNVKNELVLLRGLLARREQELLERCAGIRREAADLGNRASRYAKLCVDQEEELRRTRVQRDEAIRQRQDQILNKYQQAQVMQHVM